MTKTPITVSTSARFNASPASRPKFENGATVHAGSFTIIGTSIAVIANDSINSVISRINNSAAGVTAYVVSDRIALVTDNESEDQIVLANDTSGFLAATKLAGATTQVGNIYDHQQVLSKTFQFGSVTNGSFKVNGVSISVDRNTDSLTSVVNRINSSGAGVTAAYDTATDKLAFTSQVAGAALTLSNDTGGFLAAAHVATGTVSTQFKPDAAFNATGENAPQFDPGRSVHAGAFNVNGVAIAVAADDTVNTVLAKITASEAGVTATYDAATERITLTSKEGASGPITLGGDTEGLREALETVVQQLRDNGIRGLHVTSDGEAVTLSVNRDELVNALNGLEDDVDLEKTLAAAFERFAADVTTAAGWDAEAPATVQTLNLADAPRAQLVADQAATSLLFLQSSIQPHESLETTKKAAMKAYSS